MPTRDAVPFSMGFMLLAPPLCWSCRGPAGPGRPLCSSCRARLRFLSREPITLLGVRVWAAVAYEGPAQDLVRALKFRGALGLASTIAAHLVSAAPVEWASALVPVPLHPARRRRRGFNQAEAIAGALAPRTGLPVADCLKRAGPGPRQTGRDRSARLAGPGSSIVARARAPARPLLVDDVVTTGATLGACARALRGAGRPRWPPSSSLEPRADDSTVAIPSSVATTEESRCASR